MLIEDGHEFANHNMMDWPYTSYTSSDFALDLNQTEAILSQYRLEDPKFTFAGKTGSSQIKRFTEAQREAEVKQESLPYKDRDHALFVAFAPYKDPKYAISVLVEHGGSGGKAAAPIAKKVIKKVLERHELRQRVNDLIGENV